MVAVPTELKLSSIQGIGLFTKEFILNQSLVWYYLEGFDTTLTAEEILALPRSAQEWLYYKMWKHKAKEGYCIPRDGFTFVNHSANPNIGFEYPFLAGYACRDIQAGEELTINYLDIDKVDEEDTLWATIAGNCGIKAEEFDKQLYGVKG